jgi:hypothetical protein
VSKLAAELASTEAGYKRPGPPCTVKLVLDSIDDEDRNALELLLRNRGISASKIAGLLMKHGYRVAAPAITRHRRGHLNDGCACHPDPL